MKSESNTINSERKARGRAAMLSAALSQPITPTQANGYLAYHQGALAEQNPHQRHEQPQLWEQWFTGWHLGFDARTMILGHQFHSSSRKP